MSSHEILYNYDQSFSTVTTSLDWMIVGTGALILFVIVVWSVVILTIMEKYDSKE